MVFDIKCVLGKEFENGKLALEHFSICINMSYYVSHNTLSKLGASDVCHNSLS